jgi:GDP-D-mannose dehydratase
MKSFVTGIDGFIGGWLARLLVDRGDEVFGLSRKTAQITGDSVQRVAGDVRDAKALDDAMKRIAPDRVFHLAALNHIGASFESPEEPPSARTLRTPRSFPSDRAANTATPHDRAIA